MADALDQMMAGLAPKPRAPAAYRQAPPGAPAPAPWAARADTGPAPPPRASAPLPRATPPAAGMPTGAHAAFQAAPPVPPRRTAAPIAWPPAHGTHLEQNPRHRKYMEDEAVAVTDLLGDGCHALYAVYDGHGGRTAVDYICAQLHRNVAAELRAARGAPIGEGLQRAFMRADAALKPAGAYTAGSTAAVVLLARDAAGGPARLHLANCGDSHVLLLHRQPTAPGAAPATGGGQDGTGAGAVESEAWAEGVERLSEEHSGKSEAEIARIEAAGGTVAYGRVGGSLAVTRALGDHALKGSADGCGLTAEPHLAERLLDSQQHLAVVIGSDGLWEALTDSSIGQIARQVLQPAGAGSAPNAPPAGGGGSAAAAAAAEVARRLVRAAIERGSRDNVSAVCVVLEPAN